MAAHAVSMVLPTGETIPSPVTTTRRRVTVLPQRKLNEEAWRALAPAGHPAGAPAESGSGLGPMLVDVVDCLLDGGDLLGILVGNLSFEFLFERHHQFHRIQRISAKVVDEG